MGWFVGVFSAEVMKQWTLPAIRNAVFGTIAACGVAAIVATRGQVFAVLEVGMIVVGVVAATQEYAGKQIFTALACVPRRSWLVFAKILTVAALLALTSAGALAVSYCVAAWAGRVTDSIISADEIAALVCIGTVAFGVGFLVRSLPAALVLCLGVVVVAPTVLGGFPGIVKWLLSGAAFTVAYGDDSQVWWAMAALALWMIGAVGAGATRFLSRDA